MIGIGNIGDATRWGVDVTGTVKLGFIGLEDATLTTAYQYKDTETTDPFLGTKRRLKDTPMHYVNIDLRHDITDLGLTWGVSVHKRSRMFRTDYSLVEVRRNALHFSTIYAEYKLPKGMKVRGEIRQAFRDKKYYDKTFYDGPVSDGVIERIEDRFTNVQPTLAIKLQATF